MRRFFLHSSEKLETGAVVNLEGDEFHHLRNVCRLETGERVELLDGRGKIAVAVIDSMTKKAATLTIGEVREVPPPPQPHVEIVLCVPRFQKIDLILQKSVELGAASVSPVVSDRSFVKTISQELTGKSARRWEKIAAEACKQSGRAWPMKINEVTTLEKKLNQISAGQGLFLYEGEAATDIRSALNENFPQESEHYSDEPRSTPLAKSLAQVSVFVGAEGGFSPPEVQLFQSKNLRPVTLGPLVLRVETACIAILSIIQYHFGSMRQ